MKKAGMWAAFAAALYVLQTSLFTFLTIKGVTVDLLLLLTCSYGFLKGRRLGVLAGFLLGLMQDLASGTFFGINTFVKMTVGLLCGKLSDQVFKDQFFLPLSAAFFSAFANYLIPLAFVLMMGYNVNVAEHMKDVLPQMVVLQFLFAYPVHKLTMKFDEYVKKPK